MQIGKDQLIARKLAKHTFWSDEGRQNILQLPHNQYIDGFLLVLDALIGKAEHQRGAALLAIGLDRVDGIILTGRHLL